jgi:hypothetical protein
MGEAANCWEREIKRSLAKIVSDLHDYYLIPICYGVFLMQSGNVLTIRRFLARSRLASRFPEQAPVARLLPGALAAAWRSDRPDRCRADVES